MLSWSAGGPPPPGPSGARASEIAHSAGREVRALHLPRGPAGTHSLTQHAHGRTLAQAQGAIREVTHQNAKALQKGAGTCCPGTRAHPAHLLLAHRKSSPLVHGRSRPSHRTRVPKERAPLWSRWSVRPAGPVVPTADGAGYCRGEGPPAHVTTIKLFNMTRSLQY